MIFLVLYSTPAFANPILDQVLCQLNSDAINQVRIFSLDTRTKYILDSISNYFSPEEAELLMPLVYKYHDTENIDTLMHFLEFIERYPLADQKQAQAAMSLFDRYDPTVMIKNLILPKNRQDAVVLFAHHFSENPQIFETAGHRFDSSILSKFYTERLSYKEKLAQATSEMQGADRVAERALIERGLVQKRRVSNACLSSRHTPEMAQAGKSLAKYSTGIAIGSTLYSYAVANKDKPKDAEFYSRIGTDLALQFALGYVFGNRAGKIYSSPVSNWKKNWSILKDVTIARNGITAAIYSTIFGITLEQAEDEISRLKEEQPNEWERINAEFQQKLVSIVSDQKLQEQLNTEALAMEKGKVVYQQLESTARAQGIIKPNENLEQAMLDPEKEAQLVELLFTQNYESDFWNQLDRFGFKDEILLDSAKRFTFDTSFAVATTATGEKMLSFMALMMILCHAPVNPVAFPMALGFYVSERYLTDQLYYSGRNYLLGY